MKGWGVDQLFRPMVDRIGLSRGAPDGKAARSTRNGHGEIAAFLVEYNRAKLDRPRKNKQ